jgi:hypothetical protein
MKTLQQGKIEKTLSELFRYKEGIMTRRAHMEFLKNTGGRVECTQRRNYVAEEKEQAYLKRNAFNIPFGNENHPLTKAYNERKALLAAGFYITEYRAYRKDEECFHNILKTEFDYFNSL